MRCGTNSTSWSGSCRTASRWPAASISRATSIARLARLGEDFAIAIALVLITLLPLGTRASIVVMISIPLSLALAIVLLNADAATA